MVILDVYNHSNKLLKLQNAYRGAGNLKKMVLGTPRKFYFFKTARLIAVSKGTLKFLSISRVVCNIGEDMGSCGLTQRFSSMTTLRCMDFMPGGEFWEL